MTHEKGKGTFECPACQKPVRYNPRVRVALFDPATYVEQVHADEIAKRKGGARPVNCPHCSGLLRLSFELKLIEVVKLEAHEVPKLPSREEVSGHCAVVFTREESELIGLCRANGMMNVFAQVVEDQTHVVHRPPKDMDRFFISFLRTAHRKFLPREALSEFAKEFPGRIEFWKSQRIGMVVSDGRICRFVPMRAMNMGGKKRSEQLEVHGVGIRRESENFDYIRRTRYGYVPLEARIFLESLLHSVGDQGRAMRSILLRSKK